MCYDAAMKKTTATPHDAVFKAFLTHPATAQDFLLLHLPPALPQLCDLDILQLESGSFVEEGLSACYSDVPFSMAGKRTSLRKRVRMLPSDS